MSLFMKYSKDYKINDWDWDINHPNFYCLVPQDVLDAKI
jgi:hypothetical protein